MILHITMAAEWAAAQALGDYRLDTLDTEGFIHCSTAAQVRGTLGRFYRGIPDLVRLEIDPALLGDVELRWEGEPEAFPHIYGPLSVDAVVSADPIEAPPA